MDNEIPSIAEEMEIVNNGNVCDIINMGIPHIAEQIFSYCNTQDFPCQKLVTHAKPFSQNEIGLYKYKAKGHMCEFCDVIYNTAIEKKNHMRAHPWKVKSLEEFHF